jgi:hypothetical protein
MAKQKTIKFTKSEQNILDSLENLPSENQIVKNPYTEVEVELTPRETALYNHILNLNDRINKGETNLIQKFDRSRYLFLKLNSDAYYDLID